MNSAIRKAIAAIGLALAASVASAASISFQPSTQSVTLGNQASVDLVISGLGTQNDGVFLSAFDVDVLFDSSRLSYVGLSGASSFFDVFFDIDLGGGTIDIFGSNTLLSDAALDAGQIGDSLTLGTLTFNTLGIGLATVGVDGADPLLGLWGQLDGNGIASPLSITSNSGATIDITQNGTQLPEPGSLALAALAIAGLAAVRRRRS